MENIVKMVFQYERMPGKQKQENEFTLQLKRLIRWLAQINTVIKQAEFLK